MPVSSRQAAIGERRNADDLNRTVFISDNLPFLRRLDNGSIDLVVIDPPFGKKQTFTGKLKPALKDEELEHEYELLDAWGVQNEDDAYEIGIEFPDQSGTTASFKDIWDFRYQATKDDWDWIGERCEAAQHLIQATRLTHSDSTAAYLTFMTLRMIEIRRVLKPTGSVYLHCDHEANAYLRQMMDAVFGQSNFRNEITWQRTRGRSDGKHWGNVTDTILCYTKTDDYVWHNTYTPSESSSKDTEGDLTASEIRNGVSGQPWRGFNPTDIGRHWAVPKTSELAKWLDANKIPGYMSIADPRDRLEALDKAGMIAWSDNDRPTIIRPAESKLGAKVNNLWTDIKRTAGNERTGYPTQKPQKLAQRIIEASSNPDDIVLDCFAGCAYVPVAAELTGRRWIACDMSPRSWTVVRRQFEKHPDLGIVTEGERIDSVAIRMEHAGKVIRIRGPRDLPDRETDDEHVQRRTSETRPIEFKQKPFEDSDTIWQAFVEKWGTGCWYCGTVKPADRSELHLDHIEPNRRDGTNDDRWNRALACPPCNLVKRDVLTVEETMDKALEAGRIATPALRIEMTTVFETRRQWANETWENEIKPRRLDGME